MALAPLTNGEDRGQQNVFNNEMSATSLLQTPEDWAKWVITRLIIMSAFCRGSLGLVDGQTSLIFSLPIRIGSSSPRTAASGHSLQMFCSGQQWRGLKPSRRDYFHRAQPAPSHCPVACSVCAQRLPSTLQKPVPTASLISHPRQRRRACDGAPCAKGCRGS